MTYFGLDLTDPYAGNGNPRPVDVAVLAENLACTFTQLPALPLPQGGSPQSADIWLRSVPAMASLTKSDVLVVDGPQSLAAPSRSLRACERTLSTPGKTPWQLPVAGQRPFAGYIRGSVLLYEALRTTGWTLLGNGATLGTANLFEAYPGATWPVLGGGRLAHKTTGAGLKQRKELLERAGVSFGTAQLSHDKLDAALCSYLGWLARRTPAGVVAVGDPLSSSAGILREGQILQAMRAIPGRADEPQQLRAVPPAPSADLRRAPSVLSECEPEANETAGHRWVYFATPARASSFMTAELAIRDGVMCRSAHNERGARIANVQHLAIGDKIILTYSPAAGGDRYPIIGMFEILPPENPVAGVPAVQIVSTPHLADKFTSAGYKLDPKGSGSDPEHGVRRGSRDVNG